MKRSGSADLPLHGGHVPPWLAERMAKLGLAIVETIAMEFSTAAVISKLANPFWFQSFGAVMGMDWHSSGITTSVLGALKRSVNPHAKELGIYICGGKGRHSMKTPEELIVVGNRTGLNGIELAGLSRLTAKVDNTAIQDGFQLYQHNFIVNTWGDWCVIQQGMNNKSSMARRYHWHSENLQSFINEPHTFICGENQGKILNLTAGDAAETREKSLLILNEHPDRMLKELNHLVMPNHHDVRMKDVNMKRLGGMLWLAHENKLEDFEQLLMLKGMGPRTVQSLALVSEVIYGTPTRFEDPARFSFAHGGKDGHPFPVPIDVLMKLSKHFKRQYRRLKLAIATSCNLSKSFQNYQGRPKTASRPTNESYKYGGRTVLGDAIPPIS
jgi:hypothetical protein